jgi:SAM-dependent methyltransferase
LARHLRDEILRCAETLGGAAELWPARHGFGGGRTTATLDRELEDLRGRGETVTFAQFYAGTALKSVGKDAKHPTLGANLTEGEDWSAAGRRRFRLFRRLSGIKVRAIRVVDYGCGSLRVGQHFIRHGAPGSYVGLDVIPDFFRMGLEMIGEEVVSEKRPFLGLIGDGPAEARAAGHGANLVVSSAVAFHVHPVEMGTFVANIDGASRKPGCVVLFDAVLHPEAVRYAHRGWARPLEFYLSLFPGLRFVGSHGAKEMRREGRHMSMELLEFRR